MAFESSFLQLLAKNETVSRRLIGDHDCRPSRQTAPFFQIFDHLSPAGTGRRKTFSLGRLAIQRDPVYKRLVMRITSNENVVQASSPFRGYRFKETFFKRTFLFTRPRGNSLYFLHGELLCQGGDFAFPAGCPCPCPADDLWLMLSLG